MESEDELKRTEEAARIAGIGTKEGNSHVSAFIKSLGRKIETLTKWPTRK
jgi:hypothetical protein